MIKTKAKQSLYPPGIKKSEVSERARYVGLRINSLFDDLTDWIKDLPGFKIQKAAEEVADKQKNFKYKLPFALIFHSEKRIAEIKPAGLFAFGFNTRLEIISKKGTGIIVDSSKEKDDPDWQIIPMEAGKNPKKLNKIIFRNLLKKLIGG